MTNNPNRLTNIFVYLLAVAAIFASVVFLTGSDTEYIDNAADLNRFDFSSRVAIISPNAFDSYPEALYSPADFAGGTVAPPIYISNPRFATYRLVLDNLEEGTIYAISGYSAPHAMTLWVNGIIHARAGVPGDSFEAMTAGTNYFTVYFVAGPEPTEIIIQRSGFVLAHGGRLNPLYFGEQHLITAMHTLSHVRVGFLVGVTVMAALLNLGIFMFFKNQMRFLWFTLYCMMIALRTIGIDNRLIVTLIPGLDWQLDYLVAYLVTSGMGVTLMLYFDAMFSGELHKRFKQAVLAFFALHAVFMIATPPAVYSTFNLPYNIAHMVVVLGFLGNMIWLAARSMEKRHTEHIWVIIGTAAIAFLGITEVVARAVTPQSAVNYTQAGNIIFIFINTVALALYFYRAESELFVANEQRRNLADNNVALESMSRMKTEYLAFMSHEIKTPLTVISGNLQRSVSIVKELGIENETLERSLTKAKDEIMRMGRITETALRMAAMQETREKMSPIDATALFTTGAEAYRSVIEKRGNALIITAQKNLPRISGNADALIQVLANILTNAKNHTRNGSVAVHIGKKDDAFISVAVANTGVGIPAELLPNVFERGVTDGGGTGMGLAICKDIVTSHGGTIEIHNREDMAGVVAAFTIPIYNEAEGQNV